MAVKIKEGACQCNPTVPVHTNKEKGNRKWKLLLLLGSGLAIWILLYFLVEPAANLLTYS